MNHKDSSDQVGQPQGLDPKTPAAGGPSSAPQSSHLPPSPVAPNEGLGKMIVAGAVIAALAAAGYFVMNPGKPPVNDEAPVTAPVNAVEAPADPVDTESPQVDSDRN